MRIKRPSASLVVSIIAVVMASTGSAVAASKIAATSVDGYITSFARAQDVIDNQTGAPVALATIAGLGTITSVCEDQSKTVNKEDPRQTIAFLNQSGATVSYARQIGGGGAATISAPQNGTSAPFTIAGSNTFQLLIQAGTKSVTLQGIARQDGTNTAAAQCFTTAQVIVDN